VLSTLKQVRQPPLWWLLAASIAAALKWHFSAAESAQLGWMLRPLALTLQWLTGWQFLQTPEGNWFSRDAGIELVKACAGINFMTMSFLGWSAILVPHTVREHVSELLGEWLLRLAAALALAWITAVLVNTLRVIAVVTWQPTLQQWLAPAAAHRLIGLLIYLLALTLQLMRGNPRRLASAAVVGASLYIAVMVLVPLLSGHAAAHGALYREHALLVVAIALPLLVAGVAQPAWKTLSLLPSRSRK
jgi:exosortase K